LVLGVPADGLQDSVLPRHLRSPTRLAGELLVTHAEREDVARSGPEALGDLNEAPVRRPEPVLRSDPQDRLGPVAHRDVLALPVHVDVPGGSLRPHREMPTYAVRAVAEVTQGFEVAELDGFAR